jgi:hypothetical protein
MNAAAVDIKPWIGRGSRGAAAFRRKLGLKIIRLPADDSNVTLISILDKTVDGRRKKWNEGCSSTRCICTLREDTLFAFAAMRMAITQPVGSRDVVTSLSRTRPAGRMYRPMGIFGGQYEPYHKESQTTKGSQDVKRRTTITVWAIALMQLAIGGDCTCG